MFICETASNTRARNMPTAPVQNYALTWEEFQNQSKRFGDAPIIQSQEEKTLVPPLENEGEPIHHHSIQSLNNTLIEKRIQIRGRASNVIGKGKCCFILLRENSSSVQTCFFATNEFEKEMAKFIGKIPIESIVHIVGEVSRLHKSNPHATVPDLEIRIEKIYCISRAEKLPFNLCDLKLGNIGFSNVYYYRSLSMRGSLLHETMKLQSVVSKSFCEFMYSRDFTEIHTPKIVPFESKRESYKVDYFSSDAYLSVENQYYLQMALQGGLERVFEMASSFQAFLARDASHLNEHVSMDFGLTLNSSYTEVIDLTKELLQFLCDKLEEHEMKVNNILARESCNKIRRKTIVTLPYGKAVEMFNANYDEHVETLNYPALYQLSTLISMLYDTDIFILEKVSTLESPFYMMPSGDCKDRSNCFIIVLRGREVGQGGQYIDSNEEIERDNRYHAYLPMLKYGSFPCGGCSIGIEIFLTQYLGLGNVRRASMFPRDSKLMTP